MTKGFRRVSDGVPIGDMTAALCLLRYRTARPHINDLCYMSIKRCADILGFSYTKAHKILMEEVRKNTTADKTTRVIT